jgi:uncharacterized membrane protein
MMERETPIQEVKRDVKENWKQICFFLILFIGVVTIVLTFALLAEFNKHSVTGVICFLLGLFGPLIYSFTICILFRDWAPETSSIPHHVMQNVAIQPKINSKKKIQRKRTGNRK